MQTMTSRHPHRNGQARTAAVALAGVLALLLPSASAEGQVRQTQQASAMTASAPTPAQADVGIVASAGRDVPLPLAIDIILRAVPEGQARPEIRIEPEHLAEGIAISWTAGRPWHEALRSGVRAAGLGVEEVDGSWLIRIPTLPLPPEVPEEIEARIREDLAAQKAEREAGTRVARTADPPPEQGAGAASTATVPSTPAAAAPHAITPLVIAKQPPAAAQPRWTANANASLLSILQQWSSRAGWNLVYQFPGLPRLDAELAVEGEFFDALQQLADRMNAIQAARNEPRPKLVLYQRNSVLVVTVQEPETGRADAAQSPRG